MIHGGNERSNGAAVKRSAAFSVKVLAGPAGSGLYFGKNLLNVNGITH